MVNARERLNAIVCDGLAVDLYYADEANALYSRIGESAHQIDRATFGAFFGSIQLMLGRYLILSTVRLFDRPTSKYQVRSVPAALRLLRDNRDTLAIEQRHGLVSTLVRRGVARDEVSHLSDIELSDFVVDFFENRLSSSTPEGAANACALTRLKTARDKVIAHSEVLISESIPSTTFAEMDSLLDLARCFVAAVGFGYLSSAHETDDGHNFLASDARRSTICLTRLLERAGVIPASGYGAEAFAQLGHLAG
ncbi:MAG TPA: hypothetical protein VGQ52_10200 [Gemmatimonadaceae bacterium]|jgi:hypothetical protein|nr:hypothetical protein [Gemmatimonadaceae bacterium]